MEKFNKQERLEYLQAKRSWLKERGLDLRPNRLKEILNLIDDLETQSDEGNQD